MAQMFRDCCWAASKCPVKFSLTSSDMVSQILSETRPLNITVRAFYLAGILKLLDLHRCEMLYLEKYLMK